MTEPPIRITVADAPACHVRHAVAALSRLAGSSPAAVERVDIRSPRGEDDPLAPPPMSPLVLVDDECFSFDRPVGRSSRRTGSEAGTTVFADDGSEGGSLIVHTGSGEVCDRGRRATRRRREEFGDRRVGWLDLGPRRARPPGRRGMLV